MSLCYEDKFRLIADVEEGVEFDRSSCYMLTIQYNLSLDECRRLACETDANALHLQESWCEVLRCVSGFRVIKSYCHLNCPRPSYDLYILVHDDGT